MGDGMILFKVGGTEKLLPERFICTLVNKISFSVLKKCLIIIYFSFKCSANNDGVI